VAILNTWFTEDKSPCSGLSFHMLVSNVIIEIKILLIDQILDHFVCHPVFSVGQKYKFFCENLIVKFHSFWY
jgi:hypothetical protein